jgi:hypothetical protein
MSNTSSAGFVASLVPLLLFMVSCVNSVDDTQKKRYPSPAAVFDAYREARSGRDWRKCFSCLTSKVQDDAIFENVFACAEHDSKEERAILKKYGVDEATLTDTLKKEYKAKHGVYPDDATLNDALDKEYGADAAKSGAAQIGTKSGPPPVATNRDVMRNIVSTHVKDKAGFFEANASLLEKNAITPLGDLEQIVVNGDTATGRANVGRQIEDKIYKSFRFRRVNGGWLLDSL